MRAGIDFRSNPAKAYANKMDPKSLFRALLRAGRTFPDYNFSMYVTRRVGEEFRAKRSAVGEDAKKAIAFGTEQLEVLRRQAVVRSMYADPMPSVMSMTRDRRRQRAKEAPLERGDN